MLEQGVIKYVVVDVNEEAAAMLGSMLGQVLQQFHSISWIIDSLAKQMIVHPSHRYLQCL